jgi:bifunctional non-homologous end joining protein LigD
MPDRDPSVDPLERYWSKRDFAVTAEPRGERKDGKSQALSFVIQKHAASRLHYDLRLELDGVLLSWRCRRGRADLRRNAWPSTGRPSAVVRRPSKARSAEQHGAGTVIVVTELGSPSEILERASPKEAAVPPPRQKLAGWELVKIAKGGEKGASICSRRDGFARPVGVRRRFRPARQ